MKKLGILFYLLFSFAILSACQPEPEIIEITRVVAETEINEVTPPSTSKSLEPIEGGSLSLTDGAKVEIPPGALPRPQEVSLTRLTTMPQGNSGSLNLPGAAYDVDVETEIFHDFIEITIPYDEDLIPSGRNEQDIWVVFLHDGEWHRSYGEVDPISNTVTVKVIHASIWTWGVYKVATSEHVIEKLFGVSNMADAQISKSDAEALVNQRRFEFLQALYSLEFKQEQLEEELDFDVSETNEYMIHYVADEILEELAKNSGQQSSTKLIAKEQFHGFIHILEGSLHLFKTSFLSGDLIAEMTRVELAYQRLMVAEGQLWILEHPEATTMPPEFSEIIENSNVEELSLDIYEEEEPPENVCHIPHNSFKASSGEGSRRLFLDGINGQYSPNGHSIAMETFVLNSDMTIDMHGIEARGGLTSEFLHFDFSSTYFLMDEIECIYEIADESDFGTLRFFIGDNNRVHIYYHPDKVAKYRPDY